MADHHRVDLVVDALKMAAGRGRLRPGCIAHSDRGSEYTSIQFWFEIGELGLRQSCGRTGSCFGNAAAESFWALLKEEIGTRIWPGPPPALRSSTSSRPSITAAACANTRSSATSPRPRPGNGTNTTSQHRHRVSKITGKLQRPARGRRWTPAHAGDVPASRAGAPSSACAGPARTPPPADQTTFPSWPGPASAPLALPSPRAEAS